MAPINLKLDPEKPLGEQLVREFERLIAVGEWQPGERVPSVRTLAMQFGVNPNTIQKPSPPLMSEAYWKRRARLEDS